MIALGVTAPVESKSEFTFTYIRAGGDFLIVLMVGYP